MRPATKSLPSRRRRCSDRASRRRPGGSAGSRTASAPELARARQHRRLVHLRAPVGPGLSVTRRRRRPRDGESRIRSIGANAQVRSMCSSRAVSEHLLLRRPWRPLSRRWLVVLSIASCAEQWMAGWRLRTCHPRTEPAIAYQRSVNRNCTPCSGASSFAGSRRVASRLIARCGASDQRAPARHVRSPASASPRPA